MPVRTFPDLHPVRVLFEGLRIVEPYPTGVVAVPRQIPGSNFFPGGVGIWCGDATIVPPLPVGGVMVLGQDFHTLAGYNEVLTRIAHRPLARGAAAAKFGAGGDAGGKSGLGRK